MAEESLEGGTVNKRDHMKRRKWLEYVSKSCALLGGIIGTGVSITVLINIMMDRNWGAVPFLLLLTIGDLVILAFNLRPSRARHLVLVNGSVGLVQLLFIYLARFSIGIFLIPSTLLLFLATVGYFMLHVTHLDGEQPTQTNHDQFSSTIDHQNSAPELTSSLTSRERQVLVMLMDALSNQEIAQTLFVSQNTVRHHVHQILKKLHCSSRAQAAAIGRKEHLNFEDIPHQNPSVSPR
jgi:DNA-binding CsgD family transcriptional regulator